VARRIFGQVFTRLSKVITPPTRPLTTGSDTSLLGTDEVKVTLVQENEDRYTHDWAPIRWKSSFSLIEHRWAPTRWRRHIYLTKWRMAYTWLDTHETKVIFFINTSRLHLTWQWSCYDWVSAIQKSSSYTETSNTLHKDMMIISRSLIRYFLPTRSVYVINRTSLSHKALVIDGLCNPSS
jgi:hypothetical protein